MRTTVFTLNLNNKDCRRQKLQVKLSPQQIQLMKMLQIPTMELDQRIKQELEENPALEEGNDELEDEFFQQLRNADFVLAIQLQDVNKLKYKNHLLDESR